MSNKWIVTVLGVGLAISLLNLGIFLHQLANPFSPVNVKGMTAKVKCVHCFTRSGPDELAAAAEQRPLPLVATSILSAEANFARTAEALATNNDTAGVKDVFEHRGLQPSRPGPVSPKWGASEEPTCYKYASSAHVMKRLAGALRI